MLALLMSEAATSKEADRGGSPRYAPPWLRPGRVYSRPGDPTRGASCHPRHGFCPATWTKFSREVGVLSRADAAPSKPVALWVARVPDGGGRRHRRGGRPHGRLGT